MSWVTDLQEEVMQLQAKLQQERKIRESAEGGWHEANRVIAMQRAKLNEQEAERDALKAEVEQLRFSRQSEESAYSAVVAQNATLQSELTKARELNEKVRELAFKNNPTMPNDAPYYIVRIRDAFRAHQSAPAAKVCECRFEPGNPRVITQGGHSAACTRCHKPINTVVKDGE